MTSAIVVGGGISGIAAAGALATAPQPVPRIDVVDRGHRLGGRMAVRTLRHGPWAGHIVDLGASYFTVGRPEFGALVDDWLARGLARPWSDRFAVIGADGHLDVHEGPMRFAAPAGLRSLVESLAEALPADVRVRSAAEAGQLRRGTGDRWALDVSAVSGANAPADAEEPRAMPMGADVVGLCQPTSQALQLLRSSPANDDLAGLADACAPRRYEPLLSLVAQWPTRSWDAFSGCFVNGDPTIGFIADDGDRRGDGAAVLVAHSTPGFARPFLSDPDRATEQLVAAVRRLLDIGAPVTAEVKRWAAARPATDDGGGADGRFLLDPSGVGVAGDAFSQRPRIEAAWLSGRALGSALAALAAAS
ncbi:MAG: NAD(P)/FAD-dependent oxidoreductase [Candidatus Nanopelagicales bacterium]